MSPPRTIVVARGEGAAPLEAFASVVSAAGVPAGECERLAGVRCLEASDRESFALVACEADAIVLQGDPWSLGAPADAPTWPLAEALAAGRLHLIVHAGPGPGGVDLESARRRGSMVASVPDFASAAFAEATVRAVASLLPRPGRGARAIRWGILGLGAIGRATVAAARTPDAIALWRASSHGPVRFRTFDPFMPHELPELLEVAVVPTLDELVGTSDVLTIHLPAADATRAAVDARMLAHAPPGAVVVEAGSGVALDVVAALEALDAGRLGGLALDRRILARAMPDAADLADPARDEAMLARGIVPLDLDFAREERWSVAAAEASMRVALDCLAGNQPRHLLIDPALPRISFRS